MLKIFCEGIGDQIFIADFIEIEFNVQFVRTKVDNKKIKIANDSIEIVPIDGCKKINTDIIKQHFINNTDIGGTNLLIFDADYTGLNGNNGYKNCLAMIESLKKHEQKPIEFEHFLWPDNTSDGFFEDLLDKLIPTDKIEIVDCIKSHISCLGYVKKNHEITVPGIKEKINFYVHLHNHPSKLIERSYKNEIWCMDTNICMELASLKQFLSKYLNQYTNNINKS